MNIAIASDHAGYQLKEKIKEHLTNNSNNIEDVGTFNDESVDYPDYGKKAAELVSSREVEKAILVCGSGIGMAMTANKLKGVRAVRCNCNESAVLSRKHNDANILCLGARLTTQEKAIEIVDVWLKISFEGGRHQRRVEKIDG